eukprot:CAMPEP_0113951188 /NCGR_PEP_ID=MMETSP1339-20121228/84877_1 /TAXON_ID=94617 /ORGANISM="Fibrocapsa japonica" /LENGTH=231 /DNA_ID=CAMNT_0000959343 /DNA_START=58 /DNA_END=753 /DNA_ORIENTATION=- /assembly_acc=CAM_ASM_000762
MDVIGNQEMDMTWALGRLQEAKQQNVIDPEKFNSKVLNVFAPVIIGFFEQKFGDQSKENLTASTKSKGAVVVEQSMSPLEGSVGDVGGEKHAFDDKEHFKSSIKGKGSLILDEKPGIDNRKPLEAIEPCMNARQKRRRYSTSQKITILFEINKLKASGVGNPRMKYHLDTGIPVKNLYRWMNKQQSYILDNCEFGPLKSMRYTKIKKTDRGKYVDMEVWLLDLLMERQKKG